MEELEEDFDFVKGSEEVAEDEEATTNEAEEKEEEAEVDEENKETEDEPDEEELEEEKQPVAKDDNKAKALTAERARRKAAERELKELRASLEAQKSKEEDDKIFGEKKEAIKRKLLEKDVMDEEVADTIISALGDEVIKSQIANERREREENFDRQLSELKKDELYMDADAYKPRIKELMEKGLTMEEAYAASVSKARFSQLKKDMEVEIEQRFLNNDERASKIDVGHAEIKGEIKRGKYTKREQEIARETGLPVEEVHKRYVKPGETYSIEDIEKL